MRNLYTFCIFASILVLVVLITMTISCLNYKGKLLIDPKITNIINDKCKNVYFAKAPLPYLYTNTMHTSHWEIIMEMDNNIYISISTSRYIYVCMDLALKINEMEFLYDDKFKTSIVTKLDLKNDITPLEWATYELNYYNEKFYNLFNHNCHTATAIAIQKFTTTPIQALCNDKLISASLCEIFK